MHQAVEEVCGHLRLGESNEAGDQLVKFYIRHKFTIMNTCFEQHKRCLYMWTSANGLHWNQIDYILCQIRWRSTVHMTKMLPGADCDLDHEPLVAQLKLKLKVMKKASRPVRYDLNKISQEYAVVVSNRFQTLAEAESLTEFWEHVKKITNDAANKHIPRAKWKETLRIPFSACHGDSR